MNLSLLVLVLLSCVLSVYCAAFEDTTANIKCFACSENVHPGDFITICPARHEMHNACLKSLFECTSRNNQNNPDSVNTTLCPDCSFPLIETPKQLYDIIAGMLKVVTIENNENETDPVYRYVLEQDSYYPEAGKWAAIKGHIKYFKMNSINELADVYFKLSDTLNEENLKIFTGLDLFDKETLIELNGRIMVFKLKSFLIKTAQSRVLWNYSALAVFFVTQKFIEPGSDIQRFYSFIALTYGNIYLFLMRDEFHLFLFEIQTKIFEIPMMRKLKLLLIKAAQSRIFCNSLALAVIYVTPKLDEPCSFSQAFCSITAFIYVLWSVFWMLDELLIPV